MIYLKKIYVNNIKFLSKIGVILICLFALTFLSVNTTFADNALGGGTGTTSVPTTAVDPLQGLDVTATQAKIKKDGAPQDLQSYLGRVLGAVMALLGILFFALMIYGGINWMLARGNSGAVEEARSTITNAIIGLIVVVIAYAITQFVLKLFI